MSRKDWRIGIILCYCNNTTVIAAEDYSFYWYRNSSIQHVPVGNVVAFLPCSKQNVPYMASFVHDITECRGMSQYDYRVNGILQVEKWKKDWQEIIDHGFPHLNDWCFLTYKNIDAYITVEHKSERALLRNLVLKNNYHDLLIKEPMELIEKQIVEYVRCLDISGIIDSFNIQVNETYHNIPGKDAYYVASKDSSINTDDEFILSFFPNTFHEILCEDSPIYFDDFTYMSETQKKIHEDEKYLYRDYAKQEYNQQNHIDYLLKQEVVNRSNKEKEIKESNLEIGTLWQILQYKSIIEKFTKEDLYSLPENEVRDLLVQCNNINKSV